VNLVASFLQQARAHPSRAAIIGPDLRVCSYGALAVMVQDCAMLMSRRGVKPGTRVLLTAPLGVDLYACLAAIWSLGAVVVLPEPALGVAGVRRAAGAAKPEVWFAPWSWRALGQLFAETRAIPRGFSPPRLPPGAGVICYSLDDAIASDDSPALISFTSGTTGRPKGIVRSHALLAAQAKCLEPLLRPRRGDVDLVAFPVFVLALLGLGSTCALPDWSLRGQAKVTGDGLASRCVAAGVTRLLLPPALCERIADRPLPSSVRTVMTGGGPVYPDLLRRLMRPGVEVFAVYGSTEAEPIAHVAGSEIRPAEWEAMDSGSGIYAGLPAEGTTIRIVDDEILVTGPHVNKGYLDPEQDASTKAADPDGRRRADRRRRRPVAARTPRRPGLRAVPLPGRGGGAPVARRPAGRPVPGPRRQGLARRRRRGAPEADVASARRRVGRHDRGRRRPDPAGPSARLEGRLRPAQGHGQPRSAVFPFP
jgi:acyl-CoA synthetase (AMP-forming)/AMP-acid ligase II